MSTSGANAEGVPVGLVLDTTSFYAESGGQVRVQKLAPVVADYVHEEHAQIRMANGCPGRACCPGVALDTNSFLFFCVLCSMATQEAPSPLRPPRWRYLSQEHQCASHTHDDAVCCFSFSTLFVCCADWRHWQHCQLERLHP
jgi:hypothetical protein